MRRAEFRHRRQALIRHAHMYLRRNPPARGRCNRLRALLLRQIFRAPATQQETRDACLFRSQLQTTRGIEGERADFSGDGAQRPAAQRLFQCPAHLRIAPGGNQHQPAQVKAEGGKTRGIEIGRLRNPGNPARRCVGFQKQGEKSGPARPLFLIAPMTGNFMDRTQGNSGVPKIGIDCWHVDRQQAGSAGLRTHGRDAGNALFQLGKVNPCSHGVQPGF